MRAFLQKFRSSTSSKGTSSAYAPPSKELEKEKKFPPLPEWPPPSLNTNNNANNANNANNSNLGLNGLNGIGIGNGAGANREPYSVAPTVHLTLPSNGPLTGTTFSGSIMSATDGPRASPAPGPASATGPARSTADTVPPPVTAAASATITTNKATGTTGSGSNAGSNAGAGSGVPEAKPFTRKRASTATASSTTTTQTATQAQELSKKITLTKDNVTGFGRNTPTPPGNSTSNTTASNPPGAFEDRRKGLSQSDNGHSNATTKSAVAKANALNESQTRGSTSSNNTMGTIKTYTAGAVKNLSTRALAASPTPASANHANSSSVMHQPDRSQRHPHNSVGRYNTMGLPMADNVSLLRAGTPMSTRSTRTGVLTTASWSEAAEEDLVSNLGQRERTRQEVLWEIVASEQRYVHELMKMKETFIDPLLHPFAAPPMASMSDEDYRAESPIVAESADHLPIASKFASKFGPSSLRSVTPHLPGSPATVTNNTSGQRTTASGTPVIPTPDPGSDSEGDEYDEPSTNAGKLLGMAKGKKTSFALTSSQKANHPRSPYGTASRGTGVNPAGGGAVNPRLGKLAAQFSSRSHQSLPPPPRASSAAGGAVGATSTTSLGRKSGDDRDRPGTTEPRRGERERAGSRHAHFAPSPPPGRVLKKTRRDSEDTPKILVAFPGGVPPHVLPEDLRKCLEVIESGILLGHLKLSEALKKRYDEQYPLVRSLADIFVGNSEILNEYATYVLHLERALEQVDNALNTANALKKSKQPETSDTAKVAKLLAFLDKQASERGETGLAISLSKPFQRLLKYPLLFQNLLFHTDPSTFEYESTLEMVSEVETIVRSIEDEKIQKEERDKTRDAFARIDGLERDKILAVFKPSRLLVEEKPQEGSFADTTSRSPAPPPVAGSSRGVKQKTSFRRISEALGSKSEKEGIGSKRDLWLVVFNDVVMLCQRIGTTTLPLATTPNARSNSMPSSDATQGKSKHTPATTGRRATAQLRPRNLYRFLKVESWTINEKPKTRELVSKEAIERWRTQQASGHLMGEAGVETEDDVGGMESDDSDRKSKMSFSYWGADKVTLTKQPMSRRGVSSTNSSKVQIRTKPTAPSSFAGRQSEKESKFGGRLRSPEPSDGSAVGSLRPASRVRQAGSTVTTTRRNIGSTVDSKFVNGSTTSFASGKPGTDANARAGATTPVGAQSTKRVRNVSITSGTPRVGNPKTLSAVPSEDSGVGMYRQIIAHDPTISSIKS